jgi:hypothetical protein
MTPTRNLDFLDHVDSEVLATHVAMNLLAALVYELRKLGHAGVLPDVRFELHVTVFATLRRSRQALCNILWHRCFNRHAG